jgi:transcriptional regulator with XRE-family HTH domain
MNPNLKSIGGNIRRYRQSKGIKQEYLATRLGLTKSALSRIENGARDTTLKNILQIAVVLEINPQLFFDTGESF